MESELKPQFNSHNMLSEVYHSTDKQLACYQPYRRRCHNYRLIIQMKQIEKEFRFNNGMKFHQETGLYGKQHGD